MIITKAISGTQLFSEPDVVYLLKKDMFKVFFSAFFNETTNGTLAIFKKFYNGIVKDVLFAHKLIFLPQSNSNRTK